MNEVIHSSIDNYDFVVNMKGSQVIYIFPEHCEKLESSNVGYCTVSDGEIINTSHKIVKKSKVVF